ncbi:uncharacterized protein C6orf136 homolog [Scophthalmus maximus]|uniref:uncharacterized protein C6orf136 homolog n=1 Tax=Scophthalmus maximus TaxID=52904 RepID=UPI001FA90D0A|nr:uncharacterized protein C6orf136 homolog [Scophthalmus maximus]XP_035490144.2 uncharacterized protein C6orf136 homolog [Scophthalmus maximus]XP_035490145.2 uncharacterized protein C6orf136 homolog [Scophthalmus maximus]
MAVSRGCVAFWVGCVCSHGRRQPITKNSWTLSQAVDWLSIHQTRPLSSASWALAPPNSLRYQNIKQPVLSNLFHNASQSQRGGYYEEDWEESLSVCVLVPQGESDSLHTLLEIPLFGHNKLREILALGAYKSSEFSFPLTIVDGSREDDILMDSFKRNDADAVKREHGCFRSLFEAEKCPAPFMYGSQFYCFHCPGTEPVPGSRLKSRGQGTGLDSKAVELPLLHPTTLCGLTDRAEGGDTEGDNEGEEQLAVMYDRLRMELPNFFIQNHDFTMYSNDVEFLNGLMNTKTRGRVLYHLTLSLWRLLCLCYYAEARLEVLKLTKHIEDKSIKARWRIRGLPIYSLLLRFYRKDKSQLYRTYDAFSTFYIGRDGLINCHKVEKVMPAQPPFLPRVTSLLAGALVALGVQEHRPALNLLPLLLSSLRHSRNQPQDDH